MEFFLLVTEFFFSKIEWLRGEGKKRRISLEEADGKNVTMMRPQSDI